MLKYKIYDLSINIKNNMIKWPSDPEISIKDLYSIKKGDNLNFKEVNFGVHTGTHIDAPYHFNNKGKKIHQLNLYDLIGEVYVKEIDSPVINKKVLKNIDLLKYKRILFKTLNSKLQLLNKKFFTENYVHITKDGAKYLAKNKIKVVGIDYLSIESYKNKKGDAHKILTNANIIILESLNLSKVKEGSYLLIALPIKLYNSDGAPARIVLIKFENEK